MTFKDLNLHSNILKAIEELGYETPTPIQEKAIPIILEKSDIFASAQTGTGKTGAFLLSTMNNILKEDSTKKGKGPRIVILVPTRELAIQVAEESMKYSKYLNRVKTVCIYGGVPYPKQRKDLSRPFEILVATPGRLIDHLERGRINFKRVESFILDEADRMLDMGFIEDVEKIASSMPEDHQTLLFSATLKESVLTLSKHLLKDPKKIKIPLESGNIEQRLHNVHHLEHKQALLEHILKDESIKQAIIFTSTKVFTDELADKLLDMGHIAAALHGDINQSRRTRTINRFRQGKIRLLVATDVAARGIDVQKISHIINFDLPPTFEDYIHRIGRTGRIGKKGLAISFASYKDMRVVREIERTSKIKMAPLDVPGMKFESKKYDRKPRSPNFRGKSRFSKKPSGGFGGRSKFRSNDEKSPYGFKRKSKFNDSSEKSPYDFKRKSKFNDNSEKPSQDFKKKSSFNDSSDRPSKDFKSKSRFRNNDDKPFAFKNKNKKFSSKSKFSSSDKKQRSFRKKI